MTYTIQWVSLESGEVFASKKIDCCCNDRAAALLLMESQNQYPAEIVHIHRAGQFTYYVKQGRKRLCVVRMTKE